MSRGARQASRAGFTLVELAIVVAIIGILAALGMTSYVYVIDRARVVQAMGDIRVISMAVDDYWMFHQQYPANLAAVHKDDRLDPWGRPYEYLRISGAKGKYRKDKNLHPINTDYDLYSVGSDGKTNLALTAKVSRDDVIRANDGGFLGLAETY
jgi:general secretion pathway protein G